MIFAVDIGTSYFKASVVDIEGEIIFSSRVELKITGEGNKREADPKLWVDAFFNVYDSISNKIKSSLEAIVISGNGPTILPVDSSGRPLSNASLWMDSRSHETSSQLIEKLGHFVPGNFYLSKVFWYMKKEPEIYNSAKWFISCPEYLCYELTGNAFTLLPGDGFLPYYWDDSKLNKLGIDKSKMPDYSGLFEIHGYFKNIPVICAGPDFLMSVLGSGSVEPGIVCDRTGTSEGLNYCSDKDIEIEGLRTLPHVIPGLYTLAGLIPDSGDLIDNGKEDLLIDKFSNQLSLMVDNGLNIKDVRVIGGHSAIEELNMKKAKVLNCPLKVYAAGAELVGNAALGYFILGKYESLIEACRIMVKETACYNG